MKNYGIHIQYDGTRYSGWQKQGNTQNTIQGKIETVLEKMTDSEIEIHGSDVPMPCACFTAGCKFQMRYPKDTGSDHGISEHVSAS